MSTTEVPDAIQNPKPDAPFMRVIKTYMLRAGRMGPGQTRAFEQFGVKFLLQLLTDLAIILEEFFMVIPIEIKFKLKIFFLFAF